MLEASEAETLHEARRHRVENSNQSNERRGRKAVVIEKASRRKKIPGGSEELSAKK